ncbi:MAG TPA: PAS-domain containing protein, partial [Thermohalobaculum sp.]|nr:PAS-domain containing protein [Thermohalobaculum sp.]
MNAHDRQRLVFAAPEDLAGYELLATPIWVFDADRHAMWWGNRAALDFWGADSTEDLRARDFSSDSLVVRERLRQIVSAREPDFLIEETWTLYPRGRPRSLTAKVMPVLIEGGRNAILVEVTRMVDMNGDEGALRLLEAARASPLMISSFHGDGRLLAQNPAASEAYGIERERDSSAPGSIFRRYPESGLARRLLDIVAEDPHLDTESEVLTTFGRRWHRLHAARGRDPLTGDFTVVITEDDITARLQAQDAARISFAETEARTREDARLSMARMRAAVEAIPDGFCLYDSDDRLVLFNQRYRELYPKHSDMLEVGGRFEDMLRVGVARGEFLDAIGREEDWIAERMRAHRNPGEPLEQRLADGRWLLTEEKRTPEGETVGLRIDITEFKTLQQALEHSESRFRDFAYSAADWFWEMDADLRFTYLSGNVERLVGVPAEWHYGKTRKELMGESYDPAEWAGHEQVLRERRPFRNFEYKRVGEGVEPKWLRVSGVPVFDADGNFAGYRGSGSDVTKQRLDQERLRESEARLFRAQKMEAVGHLTGGIAHDFNNLLSVIQGNLELIEEDLADPELKSMIGASLRAVARGATLASQLLTFGRRARLSPVALNLNDQLTAMAGLIRISMPAQVEIDTRLADDLWPVEL